MLSRRPLLIVLAAATALLMFGGSPLAKEWKKIRIGTEGAYFPFNYLDSTGELQGFDIDIAEALCAAMEAECEFVTSSWASIIPGLLRNRYDAIVASMSITEDRSLIVDFTDKYYQSPARFVAPKGSNLEVSKEAMRGKILGAQRATTHAEYLLDNFQDVAVVRIYDTQEHVYLDLYNERLDAALADSLVWLEWMKRAGQGFEFVGEPLTEQKWFGEGVGIAVRKDDRDLLDQLNAALEQILADGTYQKINDKYFPFSIY